MTSWRREQIHQQGFVLITVLILLVIMLLMGLALFRNTDTASLVAGNAAAKQAATQAGNVGLVAAQNILSGTLPTSSGNGFSTTALTTDDYGIPQPTSTVTWYPSTPRDTGNSSGMSYQYIIEKLCTSAGVCTQTNVSTATTNSSLTANPGFNGKVTTAIPLYRVTVKITGPRSTTSYVQAIYGM